MDRRKRNIPRSIRRRANVYRIYVDPLIAIFILILFISVIYYMLTKDYFTRNSRHN